MFTKSQSGDVAAARREPPAWLRRWRFPVLLTAMAVVLIAAGALNSALSGLGVLEMVVGLGTGAAAIFCYQRLSRFVENRTEVTELARPQARSGLLRGMAFGAGMFLATMLLILAFGGWESVAGGSFWGFLSGIGMMASAAACEELLFRGVIFRIVEERAGTWAALALSAVVFGVVHLVNPNATLWGATAIVVESGLLFGAAYVATRSLWLPIGLHFAWNLAESGIFGTTVSGATDGAGGLLHTTLSGPTVLTGGAFGPEASLVAVLVCAVPTVLVLRRVARRGGLVRRPGRRQPTVTSPAR